MGQSAKQLYYQLKRNTKSEQKFADLDKRTAKVIKQEKKVVENGKRIRAELVELLGMDNVPISESDKLRERMRELGLDDDLDWMFGDGFWS